MARYSEKSVVSAALRAMKMAGKEYSRWTKGYYPPWKAPEYIYTTAIAQKITKLPFHPGVYCEFNAKEAMSWANTQTFGRNVSALKDGSRADILVTRADDTFRQVIEVKRRVWTSTQIKADVNRIGDVLGSPGGSSMTSGLSIFFICYVGESEKDAKKELSNVMSANKSTAAVRKKDRFKNRKKYWLIEGAEKTLSKRKLEFSIELVHSPTSQIWKESRNKYWAWNSCGLLLRPSK